MNWGKINGKNIQAFQAQASNEPQTQRVEQTDHRAVAIMLSAEAKEKLREAKRKQPKEKKQQKQQQK